MRRAPSVGVPKQRAGIQPAHTTPAHLCCVSDRLCKRGAPAPSQLPLSPQLPVHHLCVGHLGAETSGPRVAAFWEFRRTSWRKRCGHQGRLQALQEKSWKGHSQCLGVAVDLGGGEHVYGLNKAFVRNLHFPNISRHHLIFVISVTHRTSAYAVFLNQHLKP